MKLSIFTENAELNGVLLAITRYSWKFDYVQDFYTKFNKIFGILDLGLVYYWMMPRCKKMWKMNYKISGMCTFNLLTLKAKAQTLFLTQRSDSLVCLRSHKQEAPLIHVWLSLNEMLQSVAAVA
jgi:hypothetical protein